MSKPDDEQYEYTCMLLTGGRTIGIINGESYPPVVDHSCIDASGTRESGVKNEPENVHKNTPAKFTN
jgi:hypothetical protein